jgi:hypothetical protein
MREIPISTRSVAGERVDAVELARLHDAWRRTEHASRLRPADPELARRAFRFRAEYLQARSQAVSPTLRAS